jgi:hypothetical protein
LDEHVGVPAFVEDDELLAKDRVLSELVERNEFGGGFEAPALQGGGEDCSPEGVAR